MAQVFPLLRKPVISRRFSPSDMGECDLHGHQLRRRLLSNLRRDQAVILAGDKQECSRLVWMGMAVSLVVSITGAVLSFAQFSAGAAADGGIRFLDRKAVRL